MRFFFSKPLSPYPLPTRGKGEIKGYCVPLRPLVGAVAPTPPYKRGLVCKLSPAKP